MGRKRILWANLAAAIDAADDEAEENAGNFERKGWEQLALWLRELRARRIAACREPDDEVNAPADMCCCPEWHPDRAAMLRAAGGCPLHPGPALIGTYSDDEIDAATEPCPECGARPLVDGACRCARRSYRLAEVDPARPGATVEVRKRLLQTAALSVALIGVLDSQGLPGQPESEGGR
jgi:hypothetical protein